MPTYTYTNANKIKSPKIKSYCIVPLWGYIFVNIVVGCLNRCSYNSFIFIIV